MRLRDTATGVIVSVDDVRGAAMVGQHWEPVDAPADQKESHEEAPKRRGRPRKSD